MAILSALQSAATRLMGQRPSVFFGSSGKFEAELCDLINEVATDVAQYQDWQALMRVGTITGDGATSDFPFPADYGRMLVNADVADLNSWFWGYYPYGDINAFLRSETDGFNAFPGGWIIYNNRLRFSPAPEAAQTATFPYITKNWAIDASTAAKPAFNDDTDTFLLNERLLTLGLIWRWRENKKLDASGDQEAFVKALDEYAAKDKGSRIIRSKAYTGFPGTKLAWPWALGPSTYLDH